MGVEVQPPAFIAIESSGMCARMGSQLNLGVRAQPRIGGGRVPLSLAGRIVFAAVTALLLWVVVSSARRADTFAAVTYGLMALMFGLPAMFGRDSFTAHKVPGPRWLRWLYRSPGPEAHAPIKSPAP